MNFLAVGVVLLTEQKDHMQVILCIGVGGLELLRSGGSSMSLDGE